MAERIIKDWMGRTKIVNETGDGYTGPKPLIGAGLFIKTPTTPKEAENVKSKPVGVITPEQKAKAEKIIKEPLGSVDLKSQVPGFGINVPGTTFIKGPEDLAARASMASGGAIRTEGIKPPEPKGIQPITETAYQPSQGMPKIPENLQKTTTPSPARNIPAPLTGPLPQGDKGIMGTVKQAGKGIMTWAEEPAIAKGLMTAGLTMLATPPRTTPYTNAEMIGRGGLAGLGAFEEEKKAEEARKELARKGGIEAKQVGVTERLASVQEAEQKMKELNKQAVVGKDVSASPDGGLEYPIISGTTGERIGGLKVPDWLIKQMKEEKSTLSKERMDTAIAQMVGNWTGKFIEAGFSDEMAQQKAGAAGESARKMLEDMVRTGATEATKPTIMERLFRGKEAQPETTGEFTPIKAGMPSSQQKSTIPKGATPVIKDGKQQTKGGKPVYKLPNGNYVVVE